METKQNGNGSAAENFVWGASPAMCGLRQVISDTAPTEIPVLLIGESGTGKEVLALHIHRLSGHREEPFIRANCRSLAQGNLLQVMNGNGVAALWRGTIFLDNVCDLDPTGQRRLLDFLPETSPLSSEENSGTRVISTARHGLEEDLRAGRFSEDLYFQLNGVCLRVPPLRHRKLDLPELVNFFFNKACGATRERQRPTLSDEVVARLAQYSWPGNIRQLENTVRTIAATGDVEAALAELVEISPERPKVSAPASMSLKAASREASRQVERELLARALARTHWNRKRAARELQISYKALLYKLKQLGLSDSEIA